MSGWDEKAVHETMCAIHKIRAEAAKGNNLLRKILAKLPDPVTTTPGWVKCSERMPEMHQRCLVWGSSWALKGPEAARLLGGIVDITGFFTQQGVPLANVTHWAPLPAPPKDGAG